MPPRVKLESLLWIIDYCNRRSTYPGEIHSPVYTYLGRTEPLTFFTDITYAVESLYLPYVHKKAIDATDRLACELCGFHPENRYFLNCAPAKGKPTFRAARWPDGLHDGPSYHNPFLHWPGQDDPPIEPARAPAICNLCVKRDWKQDEERILGSVVSLRRSPQYLDTEEGALDIEEQYPHRVIRIAPSGQCSFCLIKTSNVIQGKSAVICPSCFKAMKSALSGLFIRLEQEGKMIGPWED